MMPVNMDDASGKLIKEKKVRRSMNCVEKTQGLIHGITYGEHGRFITSISLDEDKATLSAIPPETVAALELAMVCLASSGATH